MTSSVANEAAFRFEAITERDFDALDALFATHAQRGIDRDRLRHALPHFPAVAVWAGKEIVGFAYMFGFAPDVAELANIFVLARHQNAGLGSRLLGALLDRLPEGIEAVIAVNSDLNAVLEQKRRPDGFYERMSFKIIASTPDSTIYWWGGRHRQ